MAILSHALGLARRLRNHLRARAFLYKTNNNQIFYTLSPGLLLGLERAFRHLSVNAPEILAKGAYYEFGLFKGFSLWFAEGLSREYAPDLALYGFDSFQGLPVTEVDKSEPYWAPGAYACTKKDVSRMIGDAAGDMSRITLVEGWFSKELFMQFLADHQPRPPAIMVIDSDIYESCKIILDFFGPRFQPGTVLLFDDFDSFDASDEHGERLALKEFMATHPNFALRRLFKFGQFGVAFSIEAAI